MFNNHPRWFPAVGESLLRAPECVKLWWTSPTQLPGAKPLPGNVQGGSSTELAQSYLLRACRDQASPAFISGISPHMGTAGPSLALKHSGWQVKVE